MPHFSLLLLQNSSRRLSRQEYTYLSFSHLSGTHLKAEGRVGLTDVIRTWAEMMIDPDAPTFQPPPHREVRRITSTSYLMTFCGGMPHAISEKKPAMSLWGSVQTPVFPFAPRMGTSHRKSHCSSGVLEWGNMDQGLPRAAACMARRLK